MNFMRYVPEVWKPWCKSETLLLGVHTISCTKSPEDIGQVNDKKQTGRHIQFWNHINKSIYDQLIEKGIRLMLARGRTNFNMYPEGSILTSMLLETLVYGTQGLTRQENYAKSQQINLPKTQLEDKLITV